MQSSKIQAAYSISQHYTQPTDTTQILARFNHARAERIKELQLELEVVCSLTCTEYFAIVLCECNGDQQKARN